MSTEAFPAIDTLVPQRGRMSLLGRVLEHSAVETVCELDPARGELFTDSDGFVPAYVALEYMAQCAAVHAGLENRERSGPPRAALLLGSRRLSFATERFRPGQRLHVCARHHRGGRGLVVFDCSVCEEGNEQPLAKGRVNLYTVGDGESLETPPA